MRVLMLSQFYPPIIGGEETYVRNLSVALVQHGHDVAVATIGSPGLPDYEEDQGVRIYRIHGTVQNIPQLYSENTRHHAPPFPDPGMLFELWHIIQREKPEIVHAHNWIVRTFLPLKGRSGAKLIMSLHDYSLVCAQKILMYRDMPCDGPGVMKCIDCVAHHYGALKGIPIVASNWVMGAVEKATVDMYIPVSRAVAIHDGLIGSGLPYRVIPNFVLDDVGVLKDGFESFLCQLPKKAYLLFVGDLRRIKGVELLLKAYANLDNPPPLVMIGRECPDTPTNLPPNVTILHSWPHDAIMHAWSRCLVAFVPSLVRETFGFVALEAMTMGRPVIASDIGGLPDLVIDGKTGFLIPPGDADALQQCLSRLLNDPALRERMGNAARVRSAEFQARAVVPRIEQLYNEIICQPVRTN